MSLVVENVSHRYGSTVALTGVGLTAEPGEIVCLFGPSGCGKTTLLRLIAGLETLQAGSVRLAGAELSSAMRTAPPETRGAGMVFQDFVLFPHLNAAQNVAFGLSHLAPDARRARVDRELGEVGLAALAGRFPHELSGGQQQRVALARAFARDPALMLLDEPFASIDPVMRRTLRTGMRDLLKQRGAPALLVTHDPEEALDIGDRIAVMNEGRIVECATPEALYAAPQTIDGASMFPGAQRIAGRIENGRFRCAFGETDAAGFSDGAAAAVLHSGGAVLAENGAPASVRAVRFAAPDWRAEVESGDARLSVTAPSSPRTGDAVRIRLDPSRIRIFPALATTVRVKAEQGLAINENAN